MKKIVEICLVGSLLASSLVANQIIVTDQGKNDGNGGNAIYIDVKYADNNNNAVENPSFYTFPYNLNTQDNFKITGFQRADIGEYRLQIIHKCIEKKVYNEILILSAFNEGGEVEKQIPFTACEAENDDDSRFRTNNPYANNEDETVTITPTDISPFGEYVVTVKGKTEKNYDFITLTHMNPLVGMPYELVKSSGRIDEEIIVSTPVDLINPIKPIIQVNFKSDYSVTDEGVEVIVSARK